MVLASLGSVFVTLGVAAGFVELPYDTIAPGSAREVNDLVAVRGHEVFPPDGEVLFTTVSVRQRVNIYEALVGWLDPTIDVVPEEDVRGDLPPDEFRRLNIEAMADSKTAAEILALRQIGFTDLGAGAEVVAVEPGLPAAAVLRPKDVIVAVDGTAVSTSNEAVTAIRARQAGDVLKLRVVRDGGPPLDLRAELARAEDGRALLGVRLGTKIQLPFEITIDSGDIVGPSAGLAYALQLLDLLTPGELTGGAKVAATGALGSGGEVQPVGGVAQKAVAVERAGATLFLVPKDNEAEARSRIGGGLEVRGVATFDEALEVLGTIEGSNALALARPAGRPAA
jgi:PDZ domain-containing protein